jgi:predicted dehydrogenase
MIPSELLNEPLAPVGKHHPAHRRQIADFVDAIRSDPEPSVTGGDGRAAFEIILAV